MKVTLDLDRLLTEGKISREEYKKMMSLSSNATGSLALAVLASFGVTAVALGIGFLVSHYMPAIVLGALLSIVGFCLQHDTSRGSVTGSSVLMTVGILLFSGGLLVGTGLNSMVLFALSVVLAVASLTISSALLAALSPLYLAAAIGAGAHYEFASYHLAVLSPGFLVINTPTLTVIIFSLLAYGAWNMRELISPGDSGVVIVFARTCLLLVNMGFWVGSLWGGAPRGVEVGNFSPLAFTVVWAIALVATGAWAARSNLRWTLNLCAVFGAIHFFTQYFTHLSANPFSLLFAGVLAIGIAMTIAALNRSFPASPGSGSASPTEHAAPNSASEESRQPREESKSPGWSLPVVGAPSSQRLFP
jgi:iron complex transport system permease protein